MAVQHIQKCKGIVKVIDHLYRAECAAGQCEGDSFAHEHPCGIHYVSNDANSLLFDSILVPYKENIGGDEVSSTFRLTIFSEGMMAPSAHLTQLSGELDTCRRIDWAPGQSGKRLAIYSGTKTTLMECRTDYLIYDRVSPTIDCVELGYKLLCNGQVMAEHNKMIVIERRS